MGLSQGIPEQFAIDEASENVPESVVANSQTTPVAAIADANQDCRSTTIPDCREHVKVDTKDVALLAAHKSTGIELEDFEILCVEDVVDDVESDCIGPAFMLLTFGWWIAVGWWWTVVESLRGHHSSEENSTLDGPFGATDRTTLDEPAQRTDAAVQTPPSVSDLKAMRMLSHLQADAVRRRHIYEQRLQGQTTTLALDQLEDLAAPSTSAHDRERLGPDIEARTEHTVMEDRAQALARENVGLKKRIRELESQLDSKSVHTSEQADPDPGQTCKKDSRILATEEALQLATPFRVTGCRLTTPLSMPRSRSRLATPLKSSKTSTVECEKRGHSAKPGHSA